MLIPTIDDIEIKEKRALLRLDFNYLFKRGFKIEEFHELNLVIPTIKKLIEENARIIIAANFKNRGNTKNFEYSMEKFANIFCQTLNCDVYLTEDRVGSVVNKISQEMVPGSILLLNNFADYKDETDNNPDFAKRLSEIADIYINDAFTLSHLNLASTNSILDYFDNKNVCIGRHFESEYGVLNIIRSNEHPCAIILGTDFINEGIEILENLIDEFDKLLLLGNISTVFSEIAKGEHNTDLKIKLKDRIECLMKSLDVRGIELFYATDIFVANLDADMTTVNNDSSKDNHILLDIGEGTGNLFSEAISDVSKIIWCGEIPLESKWSRNGGTSKIIETILKNRITTVLLAKDPVIDLMQSDKIDNCIKLSRTYKTTLGYIKKKPLPAIESIEGKF